MPFDKKYYKEIKKFTLHWLSHRPWCPDYKGTPESHIEFVIGHIADFIKAQEFEAAQAAKDAVIEFVNSYYGQKIDKSILLKIPEWKQREPIRGIICRTPEPGEWGYIPDEFAKE